MSDVPDHECYCAMCGASAGECDQDVRREALLEAADEVHIEARWQEEQRRQGKLGFLLAGIDRLLMVEEILRNRATEDAT